MKNLERVLQIKYFYMYNLIFWIVLCLFELTKTYAFIVFFDYEFFPEDLILWPFSKYLIYWALSFWVLDLYLKTRHRRKRSFIVIHVFAGTLFAIIHKVISDITGVLLQRLWIGQESINFNDMLTSWRTIFFDLPSSFIIYWLVIIILLSLDYYRKFIDEHVRFLELGTRLNTAQLSTLKMQLHPHFLFNAFNTISMMIRQKNSDKAIRMVSGLSDMLRHSLTSEPQQYVSLKEEVELVKKYLFIEFERYKDRLEIEWDVDETLLSSEVPGLILQPIVENAFKHGISKSIGPSKLIIQIAKDKDFIVLEVFNTGSSIPSYFDIYQGKGVGLSNTIDRLSKLYDDNFKVQISNKNQGFSVLMKIPLRSKKAI